MGGSKNAQSSGQQTQTTTVQRTPEQIRFDQLRLGQAEDIDPKQRELNQAGADAVLNLLRGQPLPGFLAPLPGGISPEAIGAEAAELSRQNNPRFQQLGLFDSGVAFRETAEDIAKKVLFPAEQFNLQNMGQLLNLGVGGQAQVQAPIINTGSSLSNALVASAGRTTSGNFNSISNPFLPGFGRTFSQSLASSLGNTLGSPSFTFGGGNPMGGGLGGNAFS